MGKTRRTGISCWLTGKEARALILACLLVVSSGLTAAHAQEISDDASQADQCWATDSDTGDILFDLYGAPVPCGQSAPCWLTSPDSGDIVYYNDGTPVPCVVNGANEPVDEPVIEPEPVYDPWQVAYDQLGKPYIWGSAGGRTNFSPFAPGFDCSGFVSYVERVAFGRYIPSTTYTAYRVTNSLPRGVQPVKGDIVFWNMKNPSPEVQHMALYLGDGMIIQSGGRFSKVNIDNAYAIGTPEFRRLAD